MPDPNPSERLAEIEARVEAATSGPWPEDGTIFGPGGEECDARTSDYEDWATFKTHRAQADRELWIAAREDIPWLLEQVRDMQARWEKDNLCGICPYRRAVQSANERLEEQLREEREESARLRALLRRLSEWDMLYVSPEGKAVTADGPYWQAEIARALADSGEASGEAT